MPEQTANNVRSDHAGSAPARDRNVAWLLFASLAGFSLFVGDYSLVSVRVISAALFVAAALYLCAQPKRTIRFSAAFLCPAILALYGLGQIVWSDQKIIFNGLEKTLFWFTAATIAILAAQVFWNWRTAQQVRVAIALFGSFEALLDILQQASHTGKYFWIFDSGFPDVFGTFAYYNNFSQLIELTLPVTLWEGLSGRQVRFPYLILAALQTGAVIASSSRAGAVLVIVELVSVLILASWKRRGSISPAAVGFALLLTAGFSFVTGFHQVIEKLERPDQLSSRRLINESSLRMIKARPLTGWGLGSYSSVYKMFALYDDGTWINQAHNDYLEWAAEGGIPYALLMIALIMLTVRPALRSVWGIGLLAFCLHAAVDYPFARLGTCGWFFALAAMLIAQGKNDPRESRNRRKRRSKSGAQSQVANSPTTTAAASL